MLSIKNLLTLVTPFILMVLAHGACQANPSVMMTHYGWDDNDPPSAQIAFSCPRGAAGVPSSGTGTGSSPATPALPAPAASSSAIRKKKGKSNDNNSSSNNGRRHQGRRMRWSKRASNSAGGVGTYADPITMATAKGIFPKCTIVYVPRLQKYFIYEDQCASCESDAAKGIVHLDFWTGSSSGAGGSGLLKCENALTPSGDESVIVDPPNNLPVDRKFLLSFFSPQFPFTNHPFTL